MKRVSSRDNPRFKRVCALAHTARERRRSGLTVLDGPHLIRAALEAGIVPRELWVSHTGQTQPEIAVLVSAMTDDTDCVCLDDDLFARASPVASPTGLLALIALPAPPEAIRHGDWVILDQVQDPGNLGTLLRTAAAAGVAHALLTPGCAQAWSPRVLRAAMGAHFVLPISEQVDPVGMLREYAGMVVATGVGTAARSLYEADLTGAVAWLFGAEGAGLSAVLLARADAVVTIPMAARVESLNVAAAAAICLFEQRRQRGGRSAG